jgi:ATP-dependent Clp protease ATP-binding subunit ClpA
MARQGKIDPLIGRQDEIERTIQVLCRRRKNNPLLVGEAGVGKTAIAEGLAKRIVDGEVPEVLARVPSIRWTWAPAGRHQVSRGFRETPQGGAGSSCKGAGRILFIDEIHTIIGAGAASGGVMDASNLLKPVLASGELKCIGSTTYQEYRGIFEKDRAWPGASRKSMCPSPAVEETYPDPEGAQVPFEEHHDVRYSPRPCAASLPNWRRAISTIVSCRTRPSM